jgi:hypothetical protein
VLLDDALSVFCLALDLLVLGLSQSDNRVTFVWPLRDQQPHFTIGRPK